MRLIDIYEIKSGAAAWKSNFNNEIGNVRLLTFLDAFKNWEINNSYFINSVIFNEEKIHNFNLKKDDILLTATSETSNELAMSSFISENLDNAIYNAHLKRLRPKTKKVILGKYSKYWFRSKYFRNQINCKVSMTTRAVLTNSIFKKIIIDLPTIKIQQQIIDIIEPFEKLILILKKINNLVYKIGKLKEVKLRNNKKNKISNYSIVSIGGTPRTSNQKYWLGDIPWINSGILTNNLILSKYNTTKYISKKAIKDKSTKISLKSSTLISIIEPAKNKVSYSQYEKSYNQSIACLKSRTNHNGWIFFAILNSIFEISKFKSGSAQQSINKKIIENFQIFDSNNKEWFENIPLYLTQNSNLVDILNKTKDILIYKLIK